MKKFFSVVALMVFVVFTTIQCAKRGTPTGGPEDETPPVLLRATPPLNTVNFKDKEIRLYFDEYIKIKDVQKQLIISPPLETQPIISPQSGAAKYISIKISDTLKPNTTYVFNFGQSIVDNNEGNPFSYFKYALSTGDYIDSLSVKGSLKDAFNKEVDNFVTVMLYEANEAFNDSTIYNQKPTYITNTLDSLTTFEITNVKEGQYFLVAMKDKASNYIYNKKDDKIAFKKEFITVPVDSVANDFELTLFKEKNDYKAAKPDYVAKNRIVFGFEGDPEGMEIDLISDKPEDFKAKILQDKKTDTLHYWFTPFKADSMQFLVKNKMQVDTFLVRTKDRYSDSLQIESNVRGTLAPKQKFSVYGNSPIEKIQKEYISIIDKDSVAVPFTTFFEEKTNTVTLDFQSVEQQKYNITALPNAFTDMFGKVNDTLKFNLTTKKLSDYGSMTIKLNNVKSYPIIVQLTNQKGEMLYEQFSDTNETNFYFTDIEPKEYLVRIIYDDNNNKIWDTGNYFNREQPEKVIYFAEPIELRANWEVEEELNLVN